MDVERRLRHRSVLRHLGAGSVSTDPPPESFHFSRVGHQAEGDSTQLALRALVTELDEPVSHLVDAGVEAERVRSVQASEHLTDAGDRRPQGDLALAPGRFVHLVPPAVGQRR